MTIENQGTGGQLGGVLVGPAEATPARLTEVLSADGVLSASTVEEVSHEPAFEGGYSLLWPLRVRYSPAAAAGSACPRATAPSVTSSGAVHRTPTARRARSGSEVTG